MVSCREALAQTRAQLAAAGVEDTAFDAAQLLAAVAGEGWRLREAPLTLAEAEQLATLAARRAAREPLQYILGRWPFLDLELAVGPGVLCPRADTELLCEAAAALLAGNPAPHVLDLCAGTGCVGLGVKRFLPGALVTCLEKSPEAFCYLQKNLAEALPGACPPLAAVQGDVFGFEASLAPGSLDLIVSNPPYVTGSEMEALAPELGFEPAMALYAAGEGLAFYQHIAPAYRAALAPGGWLAFEIGWQQAKAVLAILQAAGYQNPACKQDMAGNDRVVLGQKL